METLAYLLAVPTLAVALVAGHIWFWRRHYSRYTPPDERHFFQAEDGWTLAFSRLRGPKGATPVICCHGLACNQRYFDLTPDLSLARHLVAEGFDVWMLDLRGAGASERPGLFGRPWNYGIIDHARLDVPAAVAYVREATGCDRPLWVGHSMGGLVPLLAGAEGLVDELGGLVTLGTPTHPEAVKLRFERVARLLRYMDWWPVARLGRWGHLILPLAGRIRARRFERLFFNPSNFRPADQRLFMSEVMEDVPRKVIRGFVDALLLGNGLDGHPVERSLERLGRVKWPTLAIGGNMDAMAPPASIQAGFEAIGSEDKEMEILGGAEGDWGHIDLVLGHRAPEVVYPRVARWLLERSSTRATEASSAPSDAAS